MSQLTQEQQEKRNQEYNDYVKQVTKTNSLLVNMIWAFIVGGIICAIGQGIGDLLKNWGVTEDNANSIVLLILRTGL